MAFTPIPTTVEQSMHNLGIRVETRRRAGLRPLAPGKAVGAIIGKALGVLNRGKGKIPVLVILTIDFSQKSWDRRRQDMRRMSLQKEAEGHTYGLRPRRGEALWRRRGDSDARAVGTQT